MCMPRISLYKPEKGKDYDFIDRQINEMFTVGGTDLYIHKYVGTDDGDVVKNETQIQDLLFLRKQRQKIRRRHLYTSWHLQCPRQRF